MPYAVTENAMSVSNCSKDRTQDKETQPKPIPNNDVDRSIQKSVVRLNSARSSASALSARLRSSGGEGKQNLDLKGYVDTMPMRGSTSNEETLRQVYK